MAFHVAYDPQCDCLIGEFIGSIDHEKLEEYALEVAEAAKEHGCRRILNDLRKAEVRFSTTEIIEIPGFLETTGIDRSWKRAVVVSQSLEDYRFYETTALNRGYTVKIFTDLTEARDWLTQEE